MARPDKASRRTARWSRARRRLPSQVIPLGGVVMVTPPPPRGTGPAGPSPRHPPGVVVLPIFPLPGLTFFPHTLLPLHIFEARYRAMVTDCLARDRRLAVVGLRPGYEATYDAKPEVYAVAGAGEIVRWERLATGRFNVLVRGDCRVRIETELPTDTLYRVGRARVPEDAG